jgi:hypothetical protein
MTTNRVEVSSEVGWADTTDEKLVGDLLEEFWKGQDYAIEERDRGIVRGSSDLGGRTSWFKASTTAGPSNLILKLTVGCEFVGADNVGDFARVLSKARHACLAFVAEGLRRAANGSIRVAPTLATSSLSNSDSVNVFEWRNDNDP